MPLVGTIYISHQHWLDVHIKAGKSSLEQPTTRTELLDWIGMAYLVVWMVIRRWRSTASQRWCPRGSWRWRGRRETGRAGRSRRADSWWLDPTNRGSTSTAILSKAKELVCLVSKRIQIRNEGKESDRQTLSTCLMTYSYHGRIFKPLPQPFVIFRSDHLVSLIIHKRLELP